MKKDATLFKRSIWYFVGLNLIALSVVLNIRYDLGVAAFSSVMYSISEIYGISLGVASILCYGLFIVLQCLLSKKITLVFVLEIPLSIFFGLLTDFYDMLLPAFSIGMPLRILCFAATMFLTALGGVFVRQEQNGADADRWDCQHHLGGLPPALLARQERIRYFDGSHQCAALPSQPQSILWNWLGDGLFRAAAGKNPQTL